jgi:glucose-1-phosphate thymidylyltransferase
MKGVILAGGLGTRLRPATLVTNKHLLPVWDKPMIYYPLNTLLNAGIKDIMIVSGPEHSGHFLNLLGSGKQFGARFMYEIQDKPGGIAHALALAENFADNEKIIVILGDNIFENSIKEYAEKFLKKSSGAMIFLKEVKNPQRFGVAEIKGDKVVNIVEKPKNPKSNLAVVGLYMYDNKVFDIIKTLKPSARGQYEITDVNNNYIKNREMGFRIIKGFWSDAGTHESLFKASKFMKNKSGD